MAERDERTRNRSRGEAMVGEGETRETCFLMRRVGHGERGSRSFWLFKITNEKVKGKSRWRIRSLVDGRDSREVDILREREREKS